MTEQLTSTETTLENTERIIAVAGGHMFYEKCIAASGDEMVFIKAHNPALFTDALAEQHTLRHLEQEAKVYTYLTEQAYGHIPRATFFDNEENILYMTAHTEDYGWHWELPREPAQQKKYTEDVLNALSQLESLPGQPIEREDRLPSLDELYEEGWKKLKKPELRGEALRKLAIFSGNFHDHVSSGVLYIENLLSGKHDSQIETNLQKHLKKPRNGLGHFDARQSNIAWQSSGELAIVDWSWASLAPAKSDSTVFLIDIFKSNFDVSKYLYEYFDKDHALLNIMHWFARGALPGHQGDETVRFHQMAAAASAATLLEMCEET